MNIRTLADALGGGRAHLANIASRLFNGRRDLYMSLGYKRNLFPMDYRSRYKRNAVANRVIKALPKATWRGGAEIIEDEEVEKTTAFEQAFFDMDERLGVWDKLYRADVLAGIGRYAIIVIGAPGVMSDPLENAGPDEIAYLRPYAEDDAPVDLFDIDPESPRYGKPVFYSLKRSTSTTGLQSSVSQTAKRIHFTRVIHVADGLLDDDIYGEPRLECVWNLLDDLEKVTGGGAEAFWKRADGGMQFDLDPTLDVGPAEKTAMKKQLHEYEHDLRRLLTTRGVKVNNLGSDVADFSRPVDSLISQISAGTGIPQRILMGSERGQLASQQDRSNWDDRASDRREEFADPLTRGFVARMVELGALPEPQKEYNVRFSAIRVMDDQQRANIALNWAGLNTAAGQEVVTVDDIRERILELPPLSEVQKNDQASAPEEQAMVAALERAIRTGNTPMLEILLGLDPVVRTIGAGTTTAAPSPDLTMLTAKLAALQARVGDEDTEQKELLSSLIETLHTLATREPTAVSVHPVINVPVPARKKFSVRVARDKDGKLADSTIEEME